MQYRFGFLLSTCFLPAVAETATEQHVFNHHRRALVAADTGASRTEQQAKMWPFSDDSEEADKGKDGDKDDRPRYGPKGCVSTWRSSKGQCIVQTECEEEDIENYNFGLVCVDTKGRPIKHVFGKGSFSARERFDTLISCHECLGLEDVPDDVLLINDIHQVRPMVKELQGDMVKLTSGLDKLNAAVFPPGPAPAPASAPASASPSGPADSAEAPVEGAEPANFAARTALASRRKGLDAKKVARRRRFEREDEETEDDGSEEFAAPRQRSHRKHVEKSVERLSNAKRPARHAKARTSKASAGKPRTAKVPRTSRKATVAVPVQPDPLTQAQNMLVKRKAVRATLDHSRSKEDAYALYMRQSRLARLQRNRLNAVTMDGQKLPLLSESDLGYSQLRR